MSKEFRKQKRFFPRKRALVTFVKKDRRDVAKLGQIVDMSMEGTALQYAPDWKKNRPGDVLFLDLFGVPPPYIIAEKIRCRVAYDISVSESPDNIVRLRRCGLHFEKITPLQSYLIGHYINDMSHDEEQQIAPSQKIRS